jgi:hypothetical protein
VQFHSPFRTGVGFWYAPRKLFSLEYIPTSNVAMLWREFTLRPDQFCSANIFGTGTVFVPAFILLICAGLFFIRVNRAVVCLFLGGLSFFASIVVYRYPNGRYYLPLLILLVAVAALPVTWAAKNFVAGKRLSASVAILALFVAACLGFPSRSGYRTIAINRSQAWDAIHFTTSRPQSRSLVAQERFVELVGHQPGIVLSDIDPVYLNALFPERIVAAPIDGKHSHRWSKIWRYDRPEALALVKRGLAQSLPVYALFVSPKEMSQKMSRLPELDGYQWSEVESRPRIVVLRLVPVGIMNDVGKARITDLITSFAPPQVTTCREAIASAVQSRRIRH